MSRATPLPPGWDAAVFTTAQARAEGVGRGRLRGSDLAHPHHGVYARRASDDLVDRCTVLRAVMGRSTDSAR